jgi:hypothetical protein
MWACLAGSPEATSKLKNLSGQFDHIPRIADSAELWNPKTNEPQ